MTVFPEHLLSLAREVLDRAREQGKRIATAESCTGGLIAACLTAIPGSSDVLDRGFVTYADASKTEMLGVPTAMIAEHGAVSQDVAVQMALGALAHSRADLAVSCTGVAGPGGGTPAKPVGLVYIAACAGDGHRNRLRLNCGDIGRDLVREMSVKAALELLRGML
jgi:nicotinamide-nucleotide amidase